MPDASPPGRLHAGDADLAFIAIELRDADGLLPTNSGGQLPSRYQGPRR
jgi:hypothetical protein